MLMIFVDEADRWKNVPLYEALVDKLARMDVAGATALAGLAGFGGSQRKRSLDERPVAVLAVDTEEKLAEVVPHLRPMAQDALMMTMDVDVLPQRVGEPAVVH